MTRSAQALAQVALAEQAVGRFVLAEAHLTTALQMQADPWIASRLPQLQQALASIQAQLGTLEIVGGVAGAELYIDGELRGRLPDVARSRVRAGSVTLELRAAGYLPVQRQVQVAAGGSWRETVAMVAVQTGAPVVVGTAPVQPAGGPVGTQPNWGLFGAGVGIVGGLWLLSGVISMAIDPNSEIAALGWIPVAGPLVQLGWAENPLFFSLLLIDGLAQIAGVVMAIIGRAAQEPVTQVALGDDADAPRLTVLPWAAPTAGGASTGVSMALSF